LSDVQRRHERLRERLGAFPNEVTAMQERRVASELEAVNNRIDKIDSTLIPFRVTGRPLDFSTEAAASLNLSGLRRRAASPTAIRSDSRRQPFGRFTCTAAS